MESFKVNGAQMSDHAVDIHAVDVHVAPTPTPTPTPTKDGSVHGSVRAHMWDKMKVAWYGLGPRTRVLLVEACFLCVAFIVVIPWYASEVTANSKPDGDLIVSFPSPLSSSGVSAFFFVDSVDALALTANTQIFIKARGNLSLSTFTDDEADEGVLWLNFFTYQSILEPYLKANNVTQVEESIIYQNATLTLTLSEAGQILLCCGDKAQPKGIVPEISKKFQMKAIKGISLYPLDEYKLQIFARLTLEIEGEFMTNTGFLLPYVAMPFPLDILFYENTADFKAAGSIESAQSRVDKPGIFDITFRSTSIDINFFRPSSIIGISFFIIALMWLLTIATFSMAVDEYFVRPTEMEMNPTKVVVATGLLFALPSLRSVQPGVPPLVVYSGTDILGFYLPMALIAISGFMMINKLIWTWQPEQAWRRVETIR